MRLRIRQIGVPFERKYAKYKAYLRQDFLYECIFCTIHENDLGGPRGMHVEHLRPKALPCFAHLECEYENLLYACPVCNSYKGIDWPSDRPVDEGKGYPDPCQVDYDDHIVLMDDLRVTGRTAVGAYLVRRLRLNRKQVLKIRRKREGLRQSIKRRIEAAEAALTEAEIMAGRDGLPADVTSYFLRVKDAAARDKAEGEDELRMLQEPIYELDDYE